MSNKTASRLRSITVATILLFSGIIFVMLPVVALRWAATPFPGFLLDPNLVVNDTGSTEWAGAQQIPPIAYPERITAVDGSQVENGRQLQALLNRHQVGDTIEITLQQPPADSLISPTTAQSERTVSITLSQLDATDLWNHFWLFYLTGLLILGIGLWTFWLRPTYEPAQILALFSALGAISIGGVFDQISSQLFIRIWVVALPLTGTLLVWLTFVFPYPAKLVQRFGLIRPLLLLIGGGVGVWSWVWLTSQADPWAYVIPWRVAYLLNGIGLLVGIGLMAYRGFRSRSPVVRQQGKLIFFAGLLAFLPIIIFFLLGAFNLNVRWLSITLYLPPLLIFPFAFGYTIVRYGLVNMKLIRRSVAYVILTSLLLVMFGLIVSGIVASFGSLAETPWLIALMVIVVALLFEPLRGWLQTGIDQIFFPQAATFDGLLRAYSRELPTAVNMVQVAALLLDYVNKGLADATPQLFLLDRQQEAFASYANPTALTVPQSSALVRFLNEQQRVIDLSEKRTWPTELSDQKPLLEAMDALLLVPMPGQPHLLGWLALCPANGRFSFSQEEVSYVTTLTDQSLIALERAVVMREMEERVQELDQLSTFAQFLAYTIDQDALFELVYTNYSRLQPVETFCIVLKHPDRDHLYTAFHIHDDERQPELEGPDHVFANDQMDEVIKTGQLNSWVSEKGRQWHAAPLNVGAGTLGAIYTTNPASQANKQAQTERLLMVFAERTAVALERLQSSEKLERRAHQLQVINQVTFSLAATLELEPLLELIMDKAIELFHAQAGSLMLKDDDSGELIFEVVRGPARDELMGKRLPLGAGLAGTVAQNGRPLITNNVAEDNRWFGEVGKENEFHSRSILTVPLLRHNRALGVVQVINKGDGIPFNENDEQLLQLFAGQAVVALENARLLNQTDQKLRKSVDELSMLQQLDRDLNTSLSLDHVLEVTLDRMITVCQADGGALVLLDREGEAEVVASRGYDKEFDATAVGGARPEGLVGQVIRNGKPHVTGNVHELEAYWRARYNTKSQMTLPLIHQDTLLGVIAIESDRFDAFSPADQETAVRVANHASISIANSLLYEQVTEANQAKSEFVSMVSHELKTPMTAIRGYVDLMLNGLTGELSDQQRNFLETIASNARRMGQQIQDLTDISRIEMNRLNMELGPTAFKNVVEETLKTTQTLYEEKEIGLELDIPEGLPHIHADKSRLVQVMTNLLSNACKYSPPKTAVFVHVKEDRFEGQPALCIAVKDQGYGISEADQEKLFTQFFRSQDPNIRQAKGTGLGLVITKGIIELHGGAIWIESEINHGTTFHFALPISPNIDQPD